MHIVLLKFIKLDFYAPIIYFNCENFLFVYKL